MRTITGKFLQADGSPWVGAVSFTLTAPFQTGEEVYPTSTSTVTLDAAGVIPHNQLGVLEAPGGGA